MKKNNASTNHIEILAVSLTFVSIHIFSMVFLRYYLGWKYLFIPSYLYIATTIYMYIKGKIEDKFFSVFLLLPFFVWFFTHILNLIRFTKEGWITIIFSIYFFVPYLIIALVAILFVKKMKK